MQAADEDSKDGAAEQADADGAGAPMSKAMRMMQSMGWSEGRGLGREGQGMATPIILQKTDKRSGIIVNAGPQGQPAAQQLPAPPPAQARVGAPLGCCACMRMHASTQRHAASSVHHASVETTCLAQACHVQITAMLRLIAA